MFDTDNQDDQIDEQMSAEESERAKMWNDVLAERAAAKGDVGAEDAKGEQPEKDDDEPKQPAVKVEATTDAKADEPKPQLTHEQEVVQELQRRIRVAESKDGNYRRDIAAMKAEIERMKAAPASQTVAQAPADDPPEWKKLKEDWPDIYESVQAKLSVLGTGSMAKDEASKIINEGITQYQARMDERLAETQGSVQKQVADEVLGVFHKDWRNDVLAPEFMIWFKKQPDEIKALDADSAPVADTVDLIAKYKESDEYTRYKERTNQPLPAASNPAQQANTAASNPASDVKARNRERLRAAVTPNNTSSAGAYRAQMSDTDMSPDQLWADVKRERDQARKRAAA